MVAVADEMVIVPELDGMAAAAALAATGTPRPPSASAIAMTTTNVIMTFLAVIPLRILSSSAIRWWRFRETGFGRIRAGRIVESGNDGE
jgi:hypothetical protein